MWNITGTEQRLNLQQKKGNVLDLVAEMILINDNWDEWVRWRTPAESRCRPRQVASTDTLLLCHD